ncbi:MAG: electron transfer flavoprotein subunit beta/FixA family protein [Phycisphaerales bacterium]|nr:electron transfer flavoprotein subunit beta/FixA family protein [Phycisphaerales bacterium]
MGYHSVVCVKQVPDTSNISGEAMKPDGTVNRAALAAIFNPEDLHALEAALDIRDAYGGTVTVLSMGPLGAAEVLRECLYRGADRAVLVTDRRAAASDTLATSYILAQAVRKLKDYDFVFCGRQAIDGDTAQVGPQMAEKLGIAQVTYFEKLVELDGRTVRVRRNVGNGWEILEGRLPLLLTVLDTANEPRPASARRVMQRKRSRAVDELRKEIAAAMPGASEDERENAFADGVEKLKMAGQLIEQWNLDDIAADLQWCGLAGSPTKVHRVQSIVLTKEGFTEVPPTEDAIRTMIHELIVDHTLG